MRDRFSQDEHCLMYTKEASSWLEALPIGNGRMGAMVFGRVRDEVVALDEMSFWSGRSSFENDNASGAEYLELIQREMLGGGESRQKCEQLLARFGGKMEHFGTSRPFARMHVDFCLPNHPATQYSRALDISNGLATVFYQCGGVSFTRELFASNPSQVMVLHIRADKKASVSFHLGVEPVRFNGGQGAMAAENGALAYRCKVHDGEVCGFARVQAVCEGGTVDVNDQGMTVCRADAATLILSMTTSFRNSCAERQCTKMLEDAAEKGYQRLKEEHISDFRSQFERVKFSLGASDGGFLPTDQRLKRSAEGYFDPSLDVLLFQYARYLMISGSRKNSPLPMHLQGLWNDNQAANMQWNCDYHLDINEQMNQWIAACGNLPEGNLALANYLKDILVPSGERTATLQYGKRGWVAHTVADAWGYSSLISMVWSMFPCGGAWIAQALWDQYDYFADKTFLRDIAYPVLKGAAEFFLDFLVQYPGTDYLVTVPSCSPEHGQASVLPFSDRVILYGLFDSVARASELLELDGDFRRAVRQAQGRLPLLEVSRHGQLKEWFENDDEDGRTNHRHTSHLLALYPYDQITIEKTPQLASAAKISLERRRHSENWEEIEWSLGLSMGYYARLKDGNSAYEQIKICKKQFMKENLFTVSPKGIAGAETEIFAVDGVMGLAAGMAEMLVQCVGGVLEFLPALPDCWPSGCIEGLRARGAFEISLQWQAHMLKSAKIVSFAGNVCSIRVNARFPHGVHVFQIQDGGRMDQLTAVEQKGVVCFSTQEGSAYILTGE